MSDKTVGHSWNQREGLCPQLISSIEMSRETSGTVSHISHASWVLDYTFSLGEKYRIRSSQQGWEIRPARVAHLYPPDLLYGEDSRGVKGARRSAWICFSWASAAPLKTLLHSRFSYARFHDPGGELGEIICAAARAGQQCGEVGFWSAQAHFCRAIDFLFQCKRLEDGVYRPRPSATESATDAFIHAVEAYLQARLSERVTLEEIARHVHTSPSTLSHRYRRVTGETPMATFMRLRITQAKALLMRGLPLKTIANHLGFSDAFHLSKTFKRIEGLSPKFFRRQHLSPSGM